MSDGNRAKVDIMICWELRELDFLKVGPELEFRASGEYFGF